QARDSPPSDQGNAHDFLIGCPYSSIIAGWERTMRIAILEDDPDQLALLRRWITDDGHDVHAYVSGREAMKMAGRESFDLFMLDWHGPGGNGGRGAVDARG